MLYTHVVEPALGTWAKNEKGEVCQSSALSFARAIEAIYSYLTPCELIFLGPVDVILLSKRALLLFCWLGVSLHAEEEHPEEDQDSEEGAR